MRARVGGGAILCFPLDESRTLGQRYVQGCALDTRADILLPGGHQLDTHQNKFSMPAKVLHGRIQGSPFLRPR